MGAIASTNFSLANLLQTLTSTGSPGLSTALSSSAVQSALQNGPSDTVELSEEAVQLQEASLLFGGSNPADTGTLPSALDPLLSAPAASGGGSSGSTASSSTPSVANQLSSYQTDLQSEEMQALFGIAPASSPPSSLIG